jgi:ABC-type transporter Mla subunit MlaD
VVKCSAAQIGSSLLEALASTMFNNASTKQSAGGPNKYNVQQRKQETFCWRPQQVQCSTTQARSSLLEAPASIMFNNASTEQSAGGPRKYNVQQRKHETVCWRPQQVQCSTTQAGNSLLEAPASTVSNSVKRKQSDGHPSKCNVQQRKQKVCWKFQQMQ